MNSFVYDIPTKVYFGQNQLGNLGAEVLRYGTRVLLCYGGGSIKKSGLYDRVKAELVKVGAKIFELAGIEPNPRVGSVNEGAAICKKENIEVVLAVGGGSVIDCAKFVAAATFYDGDAWDIMLQKVDVKKALPILSVLTLSATGSEMDTAGVISNPDTHDKIGLLFPVLRPKVSFLDPTETYTVSAYQTACGSADIMSHIIEEYFQRDQDLQMLDGFMETLMKTVITYTPVAMKKPDDYEARANLMWASSWAINGFIAGGKRQAWSCHPIEHELSAFYDITHGLGLAIVTPRWLKYCLDKTTVKKYRQFGVNVFGLNPTLKDAEIAEKSIALLEEFFFKTLGLKSTLTELDIDDTHIKTMSEKAVLNGGTMHAFKPLSATDIEQILRMCL